MRISIQLDGVDDGWLLCERIKAYADDAAKWPT